MFIEVDRDNFQPIGCSHSVPALASARFPSLAARISGSLIRNWIFQSIHHVHNASPCNYGFNCSGIRSEKSV
uniref:Uncharacterized protein n=1 Tax=Salix viminalis TaxID=40686 RepID=A0A6N2LZU1_SALVM